MARARNLKPGFFTNDVLGELDPLYRLLFAGMWCHADREGRLEDRPKKLKAEILPYDNCDVEQALQCLHGAKLVLRYVIDGVRFIQILAFKKHQNPHIKEAPSTIPAPDEHSTNPADSLFLDSLNPINTLSGKPDVVPPEKQKNGKPNFGLEAREILNFLNEKTGRRYHASQTNLGFIAARLKEGASVIECRQVIAKKCREWLTDEKMNTYLRPETLFNATKFSSYQGELVVNPADVPRETNVAGEHA